MKKFNYVYYTLGSFASIKGLAIYENENFVICFKAFSDNPFAVVKQKDITERSDDTNTEISKIITDELLSKIESLIFFYEEERTITFEALLNTILTKDIDENVKKFFEDSNFFD